MQEFVSNHRPGGGGLVPLVLVSDRGVIAMVGAPHCLGQGGSDMYQHVRAPSRGVNRFSFPVNNTTVG